MLIIHSGMEAMSVMLPDLFPRALEALYKFVYKIPNGSRKKSFEFLEG